MVVLYFNDQKKSQKGRKWTLQREKAHALHEFSYLETIWIERVDDQMLVTLKKISNNNWIEFEVKLHLKWSKIEMELRKSSFVERKLYSIGWFSTIQIIPMGHCSTCHFHRRHRHHRLTHIHTSLLLYIFAVKLNRWNLMESHPKTCVNHVNLHFSTQSAAFLRHTI